MTTEYTTNFSLAIPDFRSAPWHDLVNGNWQLLDALLYTAMSNSNIQPWANATIYTAGIAVLDADAATSWVCVVPHTSAAAPTTFAADRAAHPTYWTQLLAGFAPRGEWAYNTNYFPYDLVYSTAQGIFAICTTRHTSRASGTIKDDAAYWSFLVDMSSSALSSASVVTYNSALSGMGKSNVQDAIDFVDSVNDTQAGQIVALNNVNVTQGSRLDAIEALNTTQNSRLTAVENANTQQSNSINDHETRIDTLEGVPPPTTFPAGTKMIFANAAVPTGWVRDTSVSDRALRVVGSGSGGVSGGTAAFSTVFNKTVVGSTALTLAQIPAHNHELPFQFGGAGGGQTAGQGGTYYGTPWSFTSTVGGGAGHDHPLELRLAYYDVIIGTKS